MPRQRLTWYCEPGLRLKEGKERGHVLIGTLNGALVILSLVYSTLDKKALDPLVVELVL